MAENLIVEKKDSVAVVTLNRPEVRNAFDDVLISNLTDVLLDLDKDEAVRAWCSRAPARPSAPAPT